MVKPNSISKPNSIPEHIHSRARTGYRRITKDPVIDLILSLIAKSGLSINQVALRANLSPNTIRCWESGTTRRPQHVSVKWCLQALGYDLAAIGPSGHILLYKKPN